MMKRKWKFEIGDVVSHEKKGVGIIRYRTTMSVHEMARPVRIVDKESYSILFSADSKICPVYGESLKLVSSHEV